MGQARARFTVISPDGRTYRRIPGLRTAAHPVHQGPAAHIVCGGELVGGLSVHVLGESRQGCVSDVIHPGPAKHLHDLLTGNRSRETTPLTDTGSGQAIGWPAVIRNPVSGQNFPA